MRCEWEIDKVCSDTYMVQRKDGGRWVTLMRCDFEDMEEFAIICENDSYRVLCNGEDITSRYRESAEYEE